MLGRVVAFGALIVVLLKMVLTAAAPLTDPDTWWHLRLGHLFWGPWSLTDPGRPGRFATESWVPTQWWSELAAAKVEDWAGLPGVAFLYGLTLVLVVLAVYLACRREGDPLPAVIATALAVFAASGSLSSRPQLVSFVLLALTVWAWLGTARDGRPRWWLVPLTWLWAGAHGFWITGVVLGAAAAVGTLLDGRGQRRQGRGLAALVPVLSLLAAALTPVGPRLLTTPFAINDRRFMIIEWARTSLTDPTAVAGLLMVVVVLASWWVRRSTTWTRAILLALATAWILLSTRTVAVGAIIAAPLLAEALQGWLLRTERTRAGRGEVVTLALGAGACLGLLAAVVPRVATDPGAVPTAFAARLDALPEGTVVFNDDKLGGWLEWAHPRVVPTVDGLFDAYPVDYLREYVGAYGLRPGWQRFVTGTGAQVAILEEGSPLARALVGRLGWAREATDEGYVFLTTR